MENKELVKILNDLKITQTTGDWAECLPQDIWEDYFKGEFKEVMSGLDVDTHRWYETSVTVIKINSGYIGICFISNMFSESQDWEDCYHTITFEEMREIKITSYEPIE
jgi:hypothetical protein